MPTPMTRLARLRRLLAGEAEALLVTHLPNLLYLVGFRGSSGALVVTRRGASLFTDGRYRLQARQEVRGARVSVSSGDPLRAAARWLRRQGLPRVAYEAQRFTLGQFEQLRQELGPGVELRPARAGVEHLRAIKDAGEVSRVRAGLELTARVFEEVLPYVRPGVRELDLAAEIEYRMKQHGARAPAFETIVASGPRAAWPHGRASEKRLAKNELVIFDMGAILGDYHSDMTRTVHLGTPSARVKRTYRAVREALERAQEAVAAGVAAGRVDAAARGWLGRQGLGRYFVHGTGHGLGLEVHEEPRVGPRVRERLATGNVITLEPGVYIPGWGGVRIEDVVVVRRQGAERLTPLSRELLCL
ncbi:MAG: aminopeptidase P family protein [Acidobacteria bacterium]|nr:aminopeptidase P family protein [Acidobacteriota bacterium]